MKLASGIAPVAELLAAGVDVGLGTDGAASNNRLDLFREMRHAALLAKAARGDATVPHPPRLRMATLERRRAPWVSTTASARWNAGKQADLCAVRLDDWLLQPCFDPASHLVYVAGREHVSHVWTDGTLRICDGKLVEFEEPALLSVARLWHNRLRV